MNENNLEVKATMLNNEQVKLNVQNIDEYRKLTKHLEDKYFWHTYENKQMRPIKVVAKRLHYSCRPEEIKSYLEHKGFKITEVVNMLKRGSKIPLPMFMLTFSNDEDIRKIYEIREILGMKVDMEPLRRSKLIPQCKRCQSFQHTQKFCHREPRCVKCAGKHLTKECTKLPQTEPKCANCGEKHPASYRGCEVAKNTGNKK